MNQLLKNKSGILLADDEKNLREVIEFNLKQNGHIVFPARDGKEAWDIFLREKSFLHLALLDVSMPKINGFELCEKIKSVNPNFPVIFLTVRNEREDRIHGLKIGADDYLSKPFDLEELLLRINKILTRYYGTDEVIINDRKVNFNTFTVELTDKTTFTLSAKEAALLKYLVQNKNKVLSRQQILERIWEDKAEEASYRTIDNFIVLYRKLFENDSKNPRYFLSVRKVGYVFKE